MSNKKTMFIIVIFIMVLATSGCGCSGTKKTVLKCTTNEKKDAGEYRVSGFYEITANEDKVKKIISEQYFESDNISTIATLKDNLISSVKDSKDIQITSSQNKVTVTSEMVVGSSSYEEFVKSNEEFVEYVSDSKGNISLKKLSKYYSGNGYTCK